MWHARLRHSAYERQPRRIASAPSIPNPLRHPRTVRPTSSPYRTALSQAPVASNWVMLPRVVSAMLDSASSVKNA